MSTEKDNERLMLNNGTTDNKTEKSVSIVLVWLFFIFFPVSLVLVMMAGIIKMTIYVIQLLVQKWHS
jgi:hypothetical protein